MPRHAEAIHALGGRIVDVVNTAYGEDRWKDGVMDNPKTDCVVILGPNDLHVPMARLAAENGKLVLCEKPLGISAESVRTLAGFDKVFTVMQLRHHPLTAELRAQVAAGGTFEIDMDISVYRDEKYFRSWKGDPARSGGVLYNLGIHYFDLLQHVFGAPTRVTTTELSDTVGRGVIEGERYRCAWTVGIYRDRANQQRRFLVNGKDYNFSSQDNLSFENLHRHVYREMLEGRGVRPTETLPSVELVDRLYAAQAVPAAYAA
ncbi:MAG: Gfo/Idh/MocA family oxidoreductase [Patescibacteria group bacterium]